jgi:hypothetical protein
MSDVLKPIDVSIERDLSGGVRIRLGVSMALMSPEQAVDFALAVLKVAGVGVEFGAQFPMPKQRHFG